LFVVLSRSSAPKLAFDRIAYLRGLGVKQTRSSSWSKRSPREFESLFDLPRHA
jgi:hypothetical protein